MTAERLPNDDRRDRSTRAQGLLPILAFLVAAALTAALVFASQRTRHESEVARAIGVAGDHAISLERYLERGLSATYSLAALVRAGRGSVDDFERIGRETLSYHPGVSAVELAPEGVIRHIVPLAGNEQALGHDLLHDPERNKEAVLARDSGRLTLAGPFPLVQGGLGVAGRLPVFLDDARGQPAFWGFAIVVLKLPTALTDAQLPMLPARGYAYELSRLHPDSGQRQVIAASSPDHLVSPIERPIHVGNATWTLSVAPLGGWGAPLRLALEGSLALLASVLVGWLTRLVIALQVHRRDLETLVHERTAQLAAREADLQRAQAVAQIGSWILDGDDRHRRCVLSSEAHRILGVPGGRLLTTEEFAERIHPEDREAFRKAWTSALEGARIGVECRLLVDDALRWVRIKAELAPQSDGRRRLVGTLQDITDRKNAEQALRVAAAAFETNEGIIVADAQRRIQQVNRAYTSISGYESHEVVGQDTRVLQSGRHDERFYAAMWQSIDQTGAWAGEVWNRRKSGEMYPAWLTITAVRSDDGQVANYVATLVDITRRKAAEEEIARMAFFDALTHLPNRRMLMDRVQRALTARTRSGHCGAVLYLDLDRFKRLNDDHGHDRGDQLLCQVAARLHTSVREGDTVARLGGDEFVVLLENLDADAAQAEAQAIAVARKIIDRLSEPYDLDGLAYRITPSIGATVFDSRPTSVAMLLKQADAAMYRAKAAGRQTVCAFDSLRTEESGNGDSGNTRW